MASGTPTGKLTAPHTSVVSNPVSSPFFIFDPFRPLAPPIALQSFVSALDAKQELVKMTFRSPDIARDDARDELADSWVVSNRNPFVVTSFCPLSG